MYIRIPEYIDIGGVTYPVEFTDTLDHGRVAQIHFLDGVIQIEKDMGEEVAFVSFMHEVTHGILQAMSHHLQGMIYHDERFVEQLAQMYTHVFKQIVEYNFDLEYLEEVLKQWHNEMDKEKDEMPEHDVLNIPSL